MSDIENRPPTSVLSSKSGPKEGITKPKDKTTKPKVSYWQARIHVSLLSVNPKYWKCNYLSRRSWVVPRGRNFKPCSLQAKTRLCWWESLSANHGVVMKRNMMINTNLTHGASPCLHGWEHMSARRCHLNNQPIVANYCHMTNQPISLCYQLSQPNQSTNFAFKSN